ncbi:hypothetical protein BFG60_1557 [Microcystis aeruginosa NIES-98]|nr:hypothetical protein BFG60_1557 [Microcystis aeruginosa NIES-98]
MLTPPLFSLYSLEKLIEWKQRLSEEQTKEIFHSLLAREIN